MSLRLLALTLHHRDHHHHHHHQRGSASTAAASTGHAYMDTAGLVEVGSAVARTQPAHTAAVTAVNGTVANPTQAPDPEDPYVDVRFMPQLFASWGRAGG